MIKDSTIWFIGSALITILNITKVNKEVHFFKNILLDNLKLILALEFIMNFHSFGIIVELILFPVIVFLSIFLGIAELEEKYKPVRKLIEGLFALGGIIFLIFSIIEIVRDFSDFANFSTLKIFLLPIILTITFIPYLYLLAIYLNFETISQRISFYLKNNDNLNFAKRRAIIKCHLNLSKLIRISKKINELYNNSSKKHIEEVIN